LDPATDLKSQLFQQSMVTYLLDFSHGINRFLGIICDSRSHCHSFRD